MSLIEKLLLIGGGVILLLVSWLIYELCCPFTLDEPFDHSPDSAAGPAAPQGTHDEP